MNAYLFNILKSFMTEERGSHSMVVFAANLEDAYKELEAAMVKEKIPTTFVNSKKVVKLNYYFVQMAVPTPGAYLEAY